MRLPTIIYIGGYGRSGSTILDLMLSSEPRTLGAGELFRLWQGKLEDQFIGSEQRSLAQCIKFWADIENDIGIPRADAERIRSAVEITDFRNMQSIDKICLCEYRSMMNKMFVAIAKRGFDYVIDASKNTRPTAYRPFYLRWSGFRVHFIHLRRNFLGTMRAVARGTNRSLLEGRADRLAPLSRAVLGFHLAHAAASRCRCAAGGPWLELAFEDFVTDPAPHISRICDEVGMDATPIIKRLEAGEPFRVGYEISGNRLLKNGAVAFRRRSAVTG